MPYYRGLAELQLIPGQYLVVAISANAKLLISANLAHQLGLVFSTGRML